MPGAEGFYSFIYLNSHNYWKMKLESGDYRVCSAALESFYKPPVPPFKDEYS